jgi:spore coat protein H
MLISLTMDRNYFHNRLSFDLLNKLQIFHLDYHYTELVINERSQGIYLLMERPTDWALKEVGSPFLIRRGYNGAIDKVKAAKGVSTADKKRYNRQFREIYQAIHQLKGEALVSQLDSLMDMDEYFVWLSFNFLISNGDYSDELYFYIDKDSGKFRIVPWDYDDILKREPHEGVRQRNQRIPASSLLFSSEDRLDVAIANDPELYKRYLIQMRRVLSLLTDSLVEETLSNLYAELNPYLTSDNILKALSTDGYLTSVEKLKTDLMDVNQYIRTHKKKILSELPE